MKFILVIATTLLVTTALHSSETTDANWNKLLKTNGLPGEEQSYCYTDEEGKPQGENIDLRVRLASVSKLMTTLWAVEKLGPEFRYDTKLFIKGNNLHIVGSLDPFLGNEKMFFLVSQLNDLGFSHFDTITFDKIIQINPNAQIHSDQYPLITRESNARNLRTYFNTKSWSKDFKAEYDRIASLAKTGKFRKVVNFDIGAAVFSETNPFEGDPEARVLTLSAPPLYKYLKEINVKSNNYAAHTIFRKLGGENAFKDYMAERFNLTEEDIHFWNGSGLPEIINGVRNDNYASCRIVGDLIAALKESAEKQGKKLEDIVAVPGSDAGTFRNRVFPADYKNSFVAKTGTLMHTSTLAGAMSTKKGISFFGIFNQSTDIISSKIVQNGMVVSIMTEMGGPHAFNYIVDGFHTYGEDNIKNLDFLFDDGFLSIDQNLY
ncbi:MAG: D-alanyl-D-alanine carboxypeptidase [Bacteriovorax sp.]|jgi:D-alanyl-D-alanine carboxypeptidase/D-alanyl-D-alanine-endopeptidase (penicillin-binding protein 4)